ncbi:hypothetical protein IWW37_002875 [Coemansia sp. RSA 2050]|nr:hypothetical protein IWW37_002875 [Coemansia sp. RSA 2050]KAJ2733883.1 hypothetical protein IW152_002748 [Coemansia sp. BCRC 34962]
MTTRSRSQSIAQPAAHLERTPNASATTHKAARTLAGRMPTKSSAEDTKADSETSEAEDFEQEPSQGDVVLTSRLISELTSDSDIAAKLELVFSDPCTLARSFPQLDPVLATKCPVDVTDVCKMYTFLFARGSDELLEELRSLTISTISMMDSDPCDEHDNQMNAILILLLNPKITEYAHEYGASAFPELCSAILALTPAQRGAMMQYFASAGGAVSCEHRAPLAAGLAVVPPVSVSTPPLGRGMSAEAALAGTSSEDVPPFLHYIRIFQSYITRETNKAARRAAAASTGSEVVLQKVGLSLLSTCSLPAVAQCLALMNSYNNTHKLVPYAAFYNDAVNEHIDIKEDVPRFRIPESLSFCSYPFLLSPTTKSEIIRVESVILMRTELQDSFFRAMFSGVTCPYLVLEVRRDSLVRDTLYQLDLKLSQDLRKQLKVRFVGEEGVDEGGVQKEFFQLIVRDVFSSKYGIFKANDESQYHWFLPQANPTPDALEEMRLTGQLIGLAVYNAVILDIHLPPALYKKLLGIQVDRNDLREVDPALYHGLTQLMLLSAEELESLERTFEVEYDDMGLLRTHELIPNGAQTMLTADNREMFIDSYVDFLFNSSCARQFAEFKAGFDRICNMSYVRFMRPQELELLVCGCSDLDFGALEGSTIYDGGYSRDAQVIKHFWRVVGEFSDELKRKLLFFATSSDRVPIGGLSKLHFVIAKNGGDSDRLPTSHTCFNVLLLPEYSTIDKLRERLLTAIHNSEGFGMI